MNKPISVPEESEKNIGLYINRQQTGKVIDVLNSLEVEGRSVALDLATVDNNPITIIGRFRMQAQKENWTDEEIKAIQMEAMSGNFDHLIQTIKRFCKEKSRLHNA